MSSSMNRGRLAAFVGGFAAALALLVALQVMWVGSRAPSRIVEAGHSPETARILENITTGGGTYDPTILTKSIPGSAFYPSLSPSPSIAQCVYEGDSFDGRFHAPIELPAGARIKQVRFYGRDNADPEAVQGFLYRAEVAIPANALGGGEPVTEDKTVIGRADSVLTPGEFVISTSDNLAERTGSFSSFRFGNLIAHHRFHGVEVILTEGQRICGVEVDFQVPTVADPGSVFHPVSPYRAYDSRFDMNPLPDGPISAGTSRLIPVGQARDVSTGSVIADDQIPEGTTAVAFTVTVVNAANTGFLFVAPGDASGIDASSINWGPATNGAIANSSTVSVDDLQQIRIFAGGPGSSTDFIIDIVGYYAAPALPNMAG